MDPCGLPGTAACRIDETGTPTGTGAYGGATSAFDAANQSHRDAITNAGHSVSSLPWTFSFGLPTGNCTVLTFNIRGKEFVIDFCNSPAVALWRSVLAYMLYVLGALYIWRSATASVPTGGK